jgi:predicted transcriptional regulator
MDEWIRRTVLEESKKQERLVFLAGEECCGKMDNGLNSAIDWAAIFAIEVHVRARNQMSIRQPKLTSTEYTFYYCLCKEYPATLNELIDRLGKPPYSRRLTLVHAATVANRLVAKGYVRREKISIGHRGQPASQYAPLVSIDEVVEAEAKLAVLHLAWDDKEALAIIRRVVEEALQTPEAPTQHPRGRKAVKKLAR